MSGLRRRDFLKAAGAAAGAVALGGAQAFEAGAVPLVRSARSRLPRGSLLDVAPADSPIDTVVVVMMENRSFDHYLGWLANDDRYVERGRSRYGSKFRVDGRTDLVYPDAHGRRQRTHHLTRIATDPHPYRGCGHPVPGHGWTAGRIELAEGFLAPGTGNDDYAIGWFDGEDVPVHAKLAERFTVCDRSFASLCSGTIPNRQYFYSAQSGGERDDPGALHPGMYTTTTIWDRLEAAGVDYGGFYTDLPMMLLWGEQHRQHLANLDTYFSRAAEGTLPSVSWVEPAFVGDLRTDDHTDGDIRLGQAFVREVFDAFASSPQWEHGLFVLTYDEWGGFFEHVRPPILPDDRATRDLDTTFGLAGFRVPTILASPYARPGYVDHTVFDHTSFLRFLEWRFLGAPARGPGRDSDTWYLTARDRHANNLGEALAATDPDVGSAEDVRSVSVRYDPGCATTPVQAGEQGLGLGARDPFRAREDLAELLAAKYPEPSHRPWIT
ncbi:MAG: alkaline phosphatase family protein [Acidimicrobiia bacterium]